MSDNIKLDEIDLNILKIAGKPVEPFECGDLYYKINSLKKHGFIEDGMFQITHVSGNSITAKRGYTLTEKGKNAINSVTKPRLMKISCAHCGASYLEAIQRHTGKWQAICQSCGMRSPFMDSFENVETWARQEAEKE